LSPSQGLKRCFSWTSPALRTRTSDPFARECSQTVLGLPALPNEKVDIFRRMPVCSSSA
jgi:hypothetical protein